MAHRLYRTEGLIIDRRDVGESSRLFFILTRDFGLVSVLAQGIRALASRLRYQTQSGYLLRLDLVRGREFWRLTGALRSEEWAPLANDPVKLVAAAALHRLLRRLIRGETSQPELFLELKSGLSFITTNDLSLSARRSFLIVAGLRLVYHLGYLAPRPELEFLPPRDWGEDFLRLSPAALAGARQSLDRALVSSGL